MRECVVYWYSFSNPRTRCVCVFTCMCMCLHVCVCVYMYVCVFTCMHLYMCIYLSIHAHIYCMSMLRSLTLALMHTCARCARCGCGGERGTSACCVVLTSVTGVCSGRRDSGRRDSGRRDSAACEGQCRRKRHLRVLHSLQKTYFPKRI